MKSYLSLIPISSKIRRRQNRMTLICIVISVFLVTAIFSMVNAYTKLETINLIKKHGNWHISLKDVSKDVIKQIHSRSDIHVMARCDYLNENTEENFAIGNQKAIIYGVDKAWITTIRDCMNQGSFPKNKQEILLSSNAKELLNVGIGDNITLNMPGGKMTFTISGFGEHDSGFHNFSEPISVYMNRTAFSKLCDRNNRKTDSTWYIQCKTNDGISKAIKEIKTKYGLSDKNLRENTPVLAITGNSSNKSAQNMYPLAAILFLLVLAAGILMISSSLNNNVAQRTQFFGMMRCIGMSKKQVIRFVRMEALHWCKTAVPIGVLLGIGLTWALCIWLRLGIGGEFTELPLFTISPIGIVLGAVTGILTVFLAAQSPARHAGKVSPAAAISSNTENTKNIHRTHMGAAKIDTALGINHAISAKKNLILMTGSFALSIILFFGFSAGLDFGEVLMPSTKPWQPDFTIRENKDNIRPIDKDFAARLGKMPGVAHVYGLNTALHLPIKSKKDVSEVSLVSYDDYLFRCTKDSRISGDFSKMSGDSDYVLALYDGNNPLEAGDKIEIKGTELEVAGTVSESVYKNNITLICTEKTFARLMGESGYTMVNIQFSKDAKNKEINHIRSLLDNNYRLTDYRNNNQEAMAEFWAFEIFAYSFLIIIVLIAALNIINSTSMSVSAKIKQYGAMRAVGMSSRQVTKMIAAEVFTYAFSGCIVGCVLGLPFNKIIFETFITEYFGKQWQLPIGLLIIILLVMLVTSAIAVWIPAKRLRNMAVTETINEL